MLNQGALKAKINGISFSAVSNEGGILDGAFAELNESQNITSLSIHGNDFENIKLKTISLFVFFENSFDKVSEGTEWNAKNKSVSLGSAIGMYGGSQLDGSNFQSTSETKGAAYIKITTIDKDKKLISGTFNFTSYDEDNKTTYKITDGVFTRQPLTKIFKKPFQKN